MKDNDIDDIEDVPEHLAGAGVKPKIKIGLKPKRFITIAEMCHATEGPVPTLPAKLVKSQIISASRRTDIPAFYMPKILAAIQRGYIEVTSPYGVKSNVSLSAKDVKCFVWWSKDYSRWLELYEKEKPVFSQYMHMFNFTLTGGDLLEPGIKSSFEQRLGQLTQLVHLFGPQTVKLRFDPIVIYRNKTGQLCDNLQQFETLVKTAAGLGINQIIFAFCIDYGHVTRRMAKFGFILQKPSLDEQKTILNPLLDLCAHYGVRLQTCCNSGLIGYRQITASKCVDGEIINKLCSRTGGLKTIRKDGGQRKECNCAVSRDIGSYELQCYHNCNYCYANPKI
jgi:hypothetical protein